MSTMTAKVFISGFALTVPAVLAMGRQAPPDLILVNGKIFTSDAAHPYVQAIAVRGERIATAGTCQEIASLAGPQTERLDLGGRVVIAGINHAHYHFGGWPTGFRLRVQATDAPW